MKMLCFLSVPDIGPGISAELPSGPHSTPPRPAARCCESFTVCASAPECCSRCLPLPSAWWYPSGMDYVLRRHRLVEIVK